MRRKITNPEEYDAYYDLLVNRMEFTWLDKETHCYFYELVWGGYLKFNSNTKELFIEDYE